MGYSLTTDTQSANLPDMKGDRQAWQAQNPHKIPETELLIAAIVAMTALGVPRSWSCTKAGYFPHFVAALVAERNRQNPIFLLPQMLEYEGD
jgi:hypothetical protein